METKVRQLLIAFGAIILLAAFCSKVSALPEFASIEGHLEDRRGRAATGRFRAELKFFMTETGSTPLAGIRTKIRARRGHFNLIFMTPAEIIALDQAWFTLAIDTNRNGLDEDDLFEDRFRISEFGQATLEPRRIFSTHKVIPNSRTGSQGWPAARLHVAPFLSPPEGVVFNKMAVRLGLSAGSVFSFGIYDEDGDLVVTSGPVPGSDSGFAQLLFIEVDVEGVLAPSEKYFTAIGSSIVNGFAPQSLTAPSLDDPWGHVDGVVSAGVIPSSFNPAALTGDVKGISILLRFEEPAPPTDGESPDDDVD